MTVIKKCCKHDRNGCCLWRLSVLQLAWRGGGVKGPAVSYKLKIYVLLWNKAHPLTNWSNTLSHRESPNFKDPVLFGFKILNLTRVDRLVSILGCYHFGERWLNWQKQWNIHFNFVLMTILSGYRRQLTQKTDGKMSKKAAEVIWWTKYWSFSKNKGFILRWFSFASRVHLWSFTPAAPGSDCFTTSDTSFSHPRLLHSPCSSYCCASDAAHSFAKHTERRSCSQPTQTRTPREK